MIINYGIMGYIASTKPLHNYMAIVLRSGWWFQPLWKIWKSVGMIIRNIWENQKNVPNQQPAMVKLV
jgi:hypothetical protein